MVESCGTISRILDGCILRYHPAEKTSNIHASSPKPNHPQPSIFLFRMNPGTNGASPQEIPRRLATTHSPLPISHLPPPPSSPPQAFSLNTQEACSRLRIILQPQTSYPRPASPSPAPYLPFRTHPRRHPPTHAAAPPTCTPIPHVPMPLSREARRSGMRMQGGGG